MRFQLPLLAALTMLIVSCQNQPQTLTTSTGDKYVIHTKAGGPTAAPGDFVYFHAQMRKGDSIAFATRREGAGRPMPSFQIPETPVPGMPANPIEEVLKKLAVGDSATLYQRIDTIPDFQRPPGFEKETEIIYDLVIMNIRPKDSVMAEYQQKQEEMAKLMEVSKARFGEVQTMVQQTVKDYAAGKLASTIQTDPSGLKYIIHEQGTGPRAAAGSNVEVHYYGTLTNGKMFDNSFERGMPIPFPLGQGQVIPGWDIGIALLNQGGKATLFVPAGLGYGDQAQGEDIPANSELIFYVELEKVE